MAKPFELVPTPEFDLLAVFKSFTSVQPDPFHNSVIATPALPPGVIPPYAIPPELDSIDPVK